MLSLLRGYHRHERGLRTIPPEHRAPIGITPLAFDGAVALCAARLATDWHLALVTPDRTSMVRIYWQK
jgi:hypothetical protein